MENLKLTLPALRRALQSAPKPDDAAMQAARAHQSQLTKPAGSLGQLEDIACTLAALQGRPLPQLKKVECILFAGNHGVAAAHAVSAFPVEVTEQMVGNFKQGGAAINQLCNLHEVALKVHVLNKLAPSADFTKKPSLTAQEFRAAFEAGFSSVSPTLDMLILGEMGIGNTTTAAALTCAVIGASSFSIVGSGTGIARAQMATKRAVVEAGLQRFGKQDPLAALQHFGGWEITAIFGAMVAARLHRIPVLLDGFIVTSAAVALHAIAEQGTTHLIAAHRSAERGHKAQLAFLGLSPLIELSLRLGEASGAMTAYGIVRAALATHCGMATFAQASVASSVIPANAGIQ